MTGGEPIVEDGTMNSIEVTKEFLKENNFERLEHITVRVWIRHDRRGDVEANLISPGNIKSSLASPRRRDDSKKGFVGWTFMTVKHWWVQLHGAIHFVFTPGTVGANQLWGNWTLQVADQGDPESTGDFLGWSMTLWGECIDPAKAKPFELPGALGALPAHSGAWDSVFHQSMRDHPWRTVVLGLGLVLSVIGTIIVLHRCCSRRRVVLPQETLRDEPPMSAMERGALLNSRKSYAPLAGDDDDEPQESTFLIGKRNSSSSPSPSGPSRTGDEEEDAIMRSAKTEDGLGFSRR